MKRSFAILLVFLMVFSLAACNVDGHGAEPTAAPTEADTNEAPTESPYEAHASIVATPTVSPASIKLTEVMSIPAMRWNLEYSKPVGADECLLYTDNGIDVSWPMDYCIHDGRLYILDCGNNLVRCYDINSMSEIFNISMSISEHDTLDVYACAWCGESLYLLGNESLYRLNDRSEFEKVFSIKDNYPEIEEFKSSAEYQAALSSSISLPLATLLYETRSFHSMYSNDGAVYINYSNFFHDYHVDDSLTERTSYVCMKYCNDEVTVNIQDRPFTQGTLLCENYYPLIDFSGQITGGASQPTVKQDDSTRAVYFIKYLENYAVLYRVEAS